MAVSFAAGIEAVACGAEKQYKSKPERVTEGNSFAAFAFVVFRYRNYKRKARSRPNKYYGRIVPLFEMLILSSGKSDFVSCWIFFKAR